MIHAHTDIWFYGWASNLYGSPFRDLGNNQGGGGRRRSCRCSCRRKRSLYTGGFSSHSWRGIDHSRRGSGRKCGGGFPRRRRGRRHVRLAHHWSCHNGYPHGRSRGRRRSSCPDGWHGCAEFKHGRIRGRRTRNGRYCRIRGRRRVKHRRRWRWSRHDR